ncbi:MAG: IclR family transcriptional regulator [Alphaproteobacteria bacterium]|nr:IclR family transcriptional regulator [Alphaproteobacteria bacterium]
MSTKRKSQRGIQSVEVAAGLLRALIAAGRAAPLKDIAGLARLHPGKAHRYLVSLTRTGLVEQDAVTGHYGIGPLSIALGLAGLRTIDVVRCAQSRLPALRDAIDETVLLALWSRQGPVVFDLEESARPVTMNVRVGSILPLLTTATGRVFAAFLPAAQTRALIAAERAAARGPATALYKQQAVETLLDRTRKIGLAHVSGDLVPGVNALAAPVFDHKGRIGAVIGALGRSEELGVAFDGAVARALKRAADAISRRLGFRTL